LVTAENITVTGNTSENGGGIYRSGAFEMDGVTVSDNTATDNGGGLYISSNTTTFVSGDISDNSAGNGGGVYIAAGAFTMGSAATAGETLIDTYIETPVELPEETTIETPVETPDETPIETPVEVPDETPVEVSDETSAETDAGTADATPVEVWAEVSVEEKTYSELSDVTPIGLPEEPSVETPVETPVETVAEVPVTAETNDGEAYETTGALAVDSGSILNNSAENGGGVYIAVGGTFNLNAGDISGNTATLGNGIYVTASDRLVLAPVDRSLELGVNDAVYLPEDVTFRINAVLDTGLVADTFVPIVFENAVIGHDVAIADSNFIAQNSYQQLSSGTIQFTVTDVYIWILSATKDGPTGTRVSN
jgi:hypothetical protein